MISKAKSSRSRITCTLLIFNDILMARQNVKAKQTTRRRLSGRSTVFVRRLFCLHAGCSFVPRTSSHCSPQIIFPLSFPGYPLVHVGGTIERFFPPLPLPPPFFSFISFSAFVSIATAPTGNSTLIVIPFYNA